MAERARKTDRPMVIAGAGQGGLQVAESLREEGWEGEIILFGDEPHPPYYRPPLSKDILSEPLDLANIVLRTAEALVQRRIDFRPGVRVTGIDRAARTVSLADGSTQAYEALIIATGGRNRVPPVPGGDHKEISSIRGIDDAYKFVEKLQNTDDIIVIGAGFVGMEIAACCRVNDKNVTVIEREARVLSRAVSPLISETYERMHRERGVQFELGMSVTEVIIENGHPAGVRLSDGRVLKAGLVVAGIGLIPNDDIAKAAGLACEHGIIVDLCSRTADPNVFAIGDCTAVSHEPGMPLHRLESVQNALEQGKSAAAAIMGRERPFVLAPWFWSDQFDVKLQIVGRTSGFDTHVVRGDVANYKFSVFYFKDGVFLGADSLSRGADHMAARKILDQGLKLSADQVADESFNLAAFVKAASKAA